MSYQIKQHNYKDKPQNCILLSSDINDRNAIMPSMLSALYIVKSNDMQCIFHTAVILLSCCCHSALMLLSCCCQLLHAAVMLLSCCCQTAVILLSYWCHTAVILVSYCCHKVWNWTVTSLPAIRDVWLQINILVLACSADCFCWIKRLNDANGQRACSSVCRKSIVPIVGHVLPAAHLTLTWQRTATAEWRLPYTQRSVYDSMVCPCLKVRVIDNIEEHFHPPNYLGGGVSSDAIWKWYIGTVITTL